MKSLVPKRLLDPAVRPNCRQRRQRGQDAAEFAILLPVLLYLVIGIFDLGRATYYQSVLFNVTREAVRYGIIFPDDVAGIEALVDDRAIGLAADAVTTAVSYPDADHIQVTVEYEMPIVTPFIGLFFGGNTVTLGSQASMRIEH